MKKIVFLSIIAAALIFAGCGKPATEVKNVANAPSNIGVTKNENSTTATGPKAEIINSTKKLQEHPAWSATMESETTPELKAEMKYVAPDRYHIKKSEVEIIVIGSDSYVKEKDEWEKIPNDLSEMITAQKNAMTEEGLKKLKDVQKVGTESLNGKEADVYIYKSEPDGMVGEATTKVWIAKDNGLPLRINVESKINGVTQKITTKYNYDQNVKIEAPEVK